MAGRPRRKELYGTTTITVSEQTDLAITKILGGFEVGLPRAKNASRAFEVAAQELAAQIDAARINPGSVRFMTRPQG